MAVLCQLVVEFCCAFVDGMCVDVIGLCQFGEWLHLWTRLPPCPLVIALVPLKYSNWNSNFLRVPFTKEKMPWCPYPFKNKTYSPVIVKLSAICWWIVEQKYSNCPNLIFMLNPMFSIKKKTMVFPCLCVQNLVLPASLQWRCVM